MAIGVSMVQPWVADCSASHPSVAELRAAGAVGVVRYMDPGRNDGTEITPQEIADYHANGFPYGLVMEYSADWLEGGYSVGHADALAAIAEEARLGIPRGVTYMACDFDIQPNQYAAAYACIQGAADAYGGWQYVGVYGSKSFCEWVGAAGTVSHFWSTDAWSNYTPAANASLHQHAQWPAGVPYVEGCDHNLILGDWAPRNGDSDLTPEEHNVLWTTAKAVVQLGGAITALAQNLIHGDPTHYSLDQLGHDMGKLLPAVAALETAVGAIPASTGGTVDLTPVMTKLDNLTLKAGS